MVKENMRNFRKDPVRTDELIGSYVYAVVDDTIGGYAITTVNRPTSTLNVFKSEFELGTFMTPEVAKHFARLHNKFIQDKISLTYISNYETSNHNDYYLSVIEGLLACGYIEDVSVLRPHLKDLKLEDTAIWQNYLTGNV